MRHCRLQSVQVDCIRCRGGREFKILLGKPYSIFLMCPLSLHVLQCTVLSSNFPYILT